MEYNFLGRTGLHVSKICLGTFNFGRLTNEKDAHRIMDRAVDKGVNFFDTANHYPDFVNCGRTESIIGSWIKNNKSKRDKIIIGSKVYQPMMETDNPNDVPGLSKYKIRRHLNDSLRRLKTDYIDLFQMHHIDRRTSWEETWEAFETEVNQGKVTYIGSSNFPAWQLAIAQSSAKNRNFLGLVSEQHKYNLLCRLPELEVLPAAFNLGIGVIVWSPLESGLLAGNLNIKDKNSRRSEMIKIRSKTDSGLQKRLSKYSALCKKIGEKEANITYAWILNHEAISSIIIGPRTLKQFNDTLGALNTKLSDDIFEEIDLIFPGPGGPAPEAYAW